MLIVLTVFLAHSEMKGEGLEVSVSRAEMISSMLLKRKHLSMALRSSPERLPVLAESMSGEGSPEVYSLMVLLTSCRRSGRVA